MTNKNYRIKPNTLVSVIGGTGFIGTYIVRELAKTGCLIKVIAPYATSEGMHLKLAGHTGQISLMDSDINDHEHLERALTGSDVVVNLVGILFSKKSKNFQSMHVSAPEFLGKICTKIGVQRLIHFSALGVDRASQTSEYAKTKFAGEKAILKNYPDVTIFRPSVVFGPGDNFISMFARMLKILPFMALFGGGHTKFQPIYAGDLAQAVVKAIEFDGALVCGKTIELGGSKQYSFKEIIELVLSATNLRRTLVSVPFSIAKIQALFLQLAPKPLLTMDQVELLKYDNILIGNNGLSLFKVSPTSMESMIKTYIR